MKHFTHIDLDGYGCEFVVRTFLEKTKGKEYYKNYECIHINYDEIHNYNYRNCLITDLNFSKKDILHIKEKNLYIDHHQYDENELTAFKILEKKRKNKFIINENFCATKLTFDYFSKKVDLYEIEDIVNLINVFDLWKTDDPLFKKAFALNEIFEAYKFNNGVKTLFEIQKYGFEKYRNFYIKLLQGKKIFFNNLENDNRITKGNKTILFIPNSYDYINFYTLEYPNYEHYIIVPNPQKISLRHKNDSLKKVEKVLGKYKDQPIKFGGHQKAQFIHFLQKNEILLYNIIKDLFEEFDEEKKL